MLISQELLPLQTKDETPYVAPIPPQNMQGQHDLGPACTKLTALQCRMHAVIIAQVHYAIVHMTCKKAY